MRVGFTIIYNGAHHLLHNGWMNTVSEMLDRWVVIEGAANPGGSTSWCKELEKKSSDDGTIRILRNLELRNPLIKCLLGRPEGWPSKDRMVRYALSVLQGWSGSFPEDVFLWQLDIDEQWTISQMAEAERMLVESGADCGCFHANHFVGPGLVARGTWGEGNDPDDPLRNAYRRLWRWRGQQFATHEPPMLEGGNGREILLPQRFDHFSYYFPEDVRFKERYYQGYEGLYDRWSALQSDASRDETEFPQPLSRLITGHWGQTATVICRA